MNSEVSPLMRGMPMISSGASCDPSKDTQGRPTDEANCSTNADLPMPGAPQIKTGQVGAIFKRMSDNSFCVTEIGKFKVVPPLHK